MSEDMQKAVAEPADAAAADCMVCLVCQKPGPRRRGGRCAECKRVRVNGRNCATRIVDVARGYEADAGAQLFVSTLGGASLEQVGEALGCTKERVRQIEAGALAKLRERASEVGLSEADLDRHHVPTGQHVPASSAPRSETSTAPAPTARRSWRDATRAESDSLPEELYSPEGVRLAEALRELELRAARVAELTNHLPSPPTALTERHERTDMATITWNGQTKTVRQWAEEFDVTDAAIYARIKRGCNPDGSRKAAEAPVEASAPPAEEGAPNESRSKEEADEPAAETGPATGTLSAADLLRRIGFDVIDGGVGPNGKRVLIVGSA